MNLLHPFTITVTCGTHRAELTFGEAVEILGHAASAELVGAVLGRRRAQSIHRSREGEGATGMEERVEFQETNAIKNISLNNALRSGRESERGAGEEGERDSAPVEPAGHQQLAEYLATRLEDEKSRAFYELVARQVPRHAIQDALGRALDVPRVKLRKSRAALFTALIRPHLPPR